MAELICKRCSACGEYKSANEFHRDARQADGLMYQCKECRRILRRESYLRNREKQVARQRERFLAIKADPIAIREFYWIKNLKRRYRNEQQRKIHS